MNSVLPKRKKKHSKSETAKHIVGDVYKNISEKKTYPKYIKNYFKLIRKIDYPAKNKND